MGGRPEQVGGDDVPSRTHRVNDDGRIQKHSRDIAVAMNSCMATYLRSKFKQTIKSAQHDEGE